VREVQGERCNRVSPHRPVPRLLCRRRRDQVSDDAERHHAEWKGRCGVLWWQGVEVCTDDALFGGRV